MPARTRMEGAVLRRVQSTSAQGRYLSASQIAISLQLGVDSVRAALARMHKAGLVEVKEKHGPRVVRTWTVTELARAEEEMERKRIMTTSDEELAESGYVWHVNAADRHIAVRELQRAVDAARLAGDVLPYTRRGPEYRPMLLIIHNCDQFAGAGTTPDVFRLMQELAKLIDRTEVRVQMRSPLLPTQATIPGPLYFPSLHDDGRVTFVQERLDR